MSANADFSTPLKCLASGKKSIEQLRPSAPRHTSALELLVFYCFRILLVYPCPLYYGMLIYHVRMELVYPPWSYSIQASPTVSKPVLQYTGVQIQPASLWSVHGCPEYSIPHHGSEMSVCMHTVCMHTVWHTPVLCKVQSGPAARVRRVTDDVLQHPHQVHEKLLGG